jgi:hypothetical protein
MKKLPLGKALAGAKANKIITRTPKLGRKKPALGKIVNKR